MEVNKEMESGNTEGEMEVKKAMGVGMRKWVREVNKEMESGNAEGGKRRKKELGKWECGREKEAQ
jgi:hypothetical protein